MKDIPSSLGFPTPPPAVTDTNEYSEPAPDDYLSLKVKCHHFSSLREESCLFFLCCFLTLLHLFLSNILCHQELGTGDRQVDIEGRHQNCEQQEMGEREKNLDKGKELLKGEEGEKQQLIQEKNVHMEKTKTPTKLWDKEKEEDDKRRTSSLSIQEEEIIGKRGHVQEEVSRWNHEALTNQQEAEESRRRKDQLLAKMREIDLSIKGAADAMFSEPNTREHFAPRPPEQRIQNPSIFDLTEPEERAGSREGGRRRSGVEGTGLGRRLLRPQSSSDDLAFGSYAPSFGNSSCRGSSGFPPPPPPPSDERDRALEAIGVFSLRGLEMEKEKETDISAMKERKSSLMQQLFGTMATSPGDNTSHANKMEVLSSPPSSNGVRSRREGLFRYSSGSSTPPASSLNTVHVAESRPAIRAIASFNDDDIEELTL